MHRTCIKIKYVTHTLHFPVADISISVGFSFIKSATYSNPWF